MNTARYIIDEVERQKSILFQEFTDALDYARTIPGGNRNVSLIVQEIAFKVDPDVNQYYERDNRVGVSKTNLRRSEVGFLHGGQATRAAEVHKQFVRWCSILEFEADDYNHGSIIEYIDGDEWLCDSYIKQLLQIHPWADGNGRTASILRNWMLGTLDDPSPLPYYSF